MIKNNIPKLLQDAMLGNTYDIDVITKHLKLPWLKLDIKFDLPTDTEVRQLISPDDWRKKWQFPDTDASYQVKDWNGDIFFGPKHFKDFLQLTAAEHGGHGDDEDSHCRKLRKKVDYEWKVDENNYVRRQVSRFFPDEEDINLVNTYVLPPGGYVFPHRDYASDNIGLAKIYVALKWSDKNRFGMYGCGNIPINQGDVFLLNNYTLPHWVHNGSNDDRIVIDIGANLHSPIIKDKIIEAFKKTFNSTTKRVDSHQNIL